MIIDSAIQQATTWRTHTQADGSNIGGTPPSAFSTSLAPLGAPSARLFEVTGIAGKYCDWEAYVSRPILPNTGNLQLDFDITVLGAAASAQAIETDTIVCIGGLNYNMSLQLNYAAGGALQIANEGGSWVNVGVIPGKLPENQVVHYTINYTFDTTKKTFGIAAVKINGVSYAIPTSLQGLTAVQKGWTDGVLFQVQQDVNTSGGSWSMLLDNAQYAWS